MNVQGTRKKYFAFALVALIAVTLGATGAIILANETSGYLAGYTWIALMLVGVPLVFGLLFLGALLNLSSKTRLFGILSIMGAILIVVSSIATFKVLDALGRVRYKHEQMVPIVPEVADLVIYFKPEATHDQIENFWEETLSTRQEKGHWYRPGISGILRRFPVQGHEVIVVSFSQSATEAQREDIRLRVRSSPIVYKMKENVPTDQTEKIE